MATITTPTYLDGGTARTAGEIMAINTGGVLTIRTDTRTHLNAPATMTGSLGSVTITEGKYIWDSTAIRQLKFSGGSGTVPAIGTTISQGGVSGYLLGVWDDRKAITAVAWQALAWSEELSCFAALPKITTSSETLMTPDGKSVVIGSNTVVPTQQWMSIAWSPEQMKFIAVSTDGASHRAIFSFDGLTWTYPSSIASSVWADICWCPELKLWVAVASSGTTRATSSVDGNTFTNRTASVAVSWRGLCWAPSLTKFIAVASDGTDRIMTSADGTTWTTVTGQPALAWQSVCWAPSLGMFCAVASDGTTQQVMTSTDGATWTLQTSVSGTWSKVCWSSTLSMFCAVSSAGTNTVMTSTNGVDWTARTGIAANAWRDVKWAAGLGKFMAIASSGTYRHMMSDDGIAWYIPQVDQPILAPTAPAAAMPPTGFIKFREVTGGSFAAGALTGITANATGAEVQGWMEIVHDTAANITVPRLGEHKARGGRVYLGTTNGKINQIFQVPTNASTAQVMPGLYIEKEPDSANTDDDYEIWPGLADTTNGWNHVNIGEAPTLLDERKKFVKALPGGMLQIGEPFGIHASFIHVAATNATYAGLTLSGTYTWESNVVIVTVAVGHLLDNGQQVGLDFTTGSATDVIATITVISPFVFTIPVSGSGTGGNVTVRVGLLVTFTNHGLPTGSRLYCTFGTGSVTGSEVYEIWRIPSTSTFVIKYPTITAVTAGNVGYNAIATINQFTANQMAVGNKVKINFLTGGWQSLSGTYTIYTAASASQFTIQIPWQVVASAEMATVHRIIGSIPPAGCRVWVPSNILTECGTTTRAINNLPHATLASRPEWVTTSAATLDLEYVYATSGYPNFAQAYSVKLKYCLFFDTLIISECATAFDVRHTGCGMATALDTVTLSLTSNFAGGYITNGKFERGNIPGASDHAAYLQYCDGVVIENTQFGIIQFARSSGASINIAYCANTELNDCRVINGNVGVLTSTDTKINNIDYCDRYTGMTNITTGLYAVNIATKADRTVVDGITFGFGNTIPNCHPVSGLVTIAGTTDAKVRNVGTYAAPLSGGTYWESSYGLTLLINIAGNNRNCKFQRLYADKVRTAPYTTINSSKNITYENIQAGFYINSSKTLLAQAHADLNGVIRGVCEINNTTGQASVYGTHWRDIFMGTSAGRIVLAFNEPTVETTQQFSMLSGTAKFNSTGGLLLSTVGNQCQWEMAYFAKGHTGFANVAATMSGGTITNYTLEFQYDIGAGYNGTWLTLNGTNLSAITVDPSIGIKLKYRITTVIANTTAITFIRIDTVSTALGQATALYELDTVTLTIKANVSLLGAEIRVYDLDNSPAGSLGSELAGTESCGSSQFSYAGMPGNSIWVQIMKTGYEEFGLATTMPAADGEFEALLYMDLNT